VNTVGMKEWMAQWQADSKQGLWVLTGILTKNFSKDDKVKETMAFMKDYVVDHFNEEEAYQAKINYPELEAHKKAHASFKEGIENYVKIFEEEGFNEDRIQEFGGKLMTWLIMHVAGMDQKIGEYVKSKGGQIQ